MEKKVLEKYKKAGEIAKKVKKFAKSRIKPGMTHLEVAEMIDDKITELGAKPSFPADVSVNDCAAHYCPYYQDKSVLNKGDLVKVDMGAHIDGYLVDTAFTISLGGPKEHKELIEAAEAAVAAALKLAKPGVSLGKIGRAIEDEIKARGFKSIRNLSGHTVEPYLVHAGLGIPNVDTGSSKKLEKDWVVAIEPFPSTGSGEVVEGKSCKVFEVKKLKNVRQHRDVLQYIWEEYRTLPFCERNIIKKFGVLKTRLALRDFVRTGILHEYTVLNEAEKGSFVAQAEHTVIVNEEPIVLT